jgi:hypothetical protein
MFPRIHKYGLPPIRALSHVCCGVRRAACGGRGWGGWGGERKGRKDQVKRNTDFRVDAKSSTRITILTEQETEDRPSLAKLRKNPWTEPGVRGRGPRCKLKPRIRTGMRN